MFAKIALAALLIAAVLAADVDPTGQYTRTACKCNSFLANCDTYFDKSYTATYNGTLSMTPKDPKYPTPSGSFAADNIKVNVPGVGSCTGVWVADKHDAKLKCTSSLISSIKCDVTFHCASGPCSK